MNFLKGCMISSLPEKVRGGRGRNRDQWRGRSSISGYGRTGLSAHTLTPQHMAREAVPLSSTAGIFSHIETPTQGNIYRECGKFFLWNTKIKLSSSLALH